MTLELRECVNNAEIIGIVKKVELEEKVSKNTGKDMIIGYVDVEVKEDGKISNIRCKAFSFALTKAGKPNGLFKGYKTVKDEYQPGDLVRVTGNIVFNEYYTEQGEYRGFNEIKAVFFNRVDDLETKHKAVATVEMVVEGITPQIEEDVPTGNFEVDAFTIGYGGSFIPLSNMIIGADLAQVFQGMYFPGTTGKITFKINNYAELEKVEVAVEQPGFGSAERVEESVVTNYTSNFEIIGGDLPYQDGVNNYTPEEIEQAHKNRELALQQLKDEASTVPSTPPTGFGSNGELSDDKKAEIDAAVSHLENTFKDAGTKEEVPDF